MNKEQKNPWENNSIESVTSSLNSTFSNRTLNDIDVRRIISIWPYILFMAIIGFTAGRVYTKYMVDNHTVATKVNIQQKEEISLQQAVIGTSRDPFNDKIGFLKSPAISYNVVDRLNLMYNSILKGRFKDKSLYGIIQWKIINDTLSQAPKNNFSFSIIRKGEQFMLIYKNTTFSNFSFGKPIVVGGHVIVVDTLKTFDFNSPIECKYIDKWSLASLVSSNLNIVASKESNIIDITYTDISTERAIDILNKLVEIYNKTLSEDKSQAYSQAIDFINKRFQPLANELDSIENSLSDYQSNRGFVGENSNGVLYLENLQEVDKKLIDIEIQKSNIDSIDQYLNHNKGKDINYAIVGISDLNLQNNLSLLTNLKAEKERMSIVTTKDYPDYKILDKNIQSLVTTIKQQFVEYKKSIDLSRQLCLKNISEISNQIKKTPQDEKGLADIKRMRNIKEALFLTLIQKREESAIAKASTTVDTKVLNPPTVIQTKEKTSKPMIWSIFTLIGILIPVVFVIIKEVVNNKIISKTQLENYLKIPVIAEFELIEKAKNKVESLLNKTDRSMFGEQLRALRTQLTFYQKESKPLFIMITSNMSGEGKSFVSLNLAKSFALQNKKVALLEFDLRRPKISSSLKVNKTIGLSNFLTGNINIDNIAIKPFEENQNFDFYAAGPIPPNPQELLSNSKMSELHTFLQNNYEVVIIDTPPYGIVADAQIIGKIVDITLVITRFGLTFKEQVVEIEKWNEKKIFPSMAVVFNGIKRKGYYGQKYGYYYYKTKYGYDYYTSKESI